MLEKKKEMQGTMEMGVSVGGERVVKKVESENSENSETKYTQNLNLMMHADSKRTFPALFPNAK